MNINIAIRKVEHDSDDYGNRFIHARFSIQGRTYETSLIDGTLDRNSMDLDGDICDAVDDAIQNFMLTNKISPEPYSLDELSAQATLLGERLGKHYVLYETAQSLELLELTECVQKRAGAFNSRAEFSLWVRDRLSDPGLEFSETSENPE